ncbi:hypothetical protein GCM10010286_39450 [Streptomyces toxytricini]|nr:hypothetical protein GCM10010286_39450 [Streptomyces toxytricini]
MPPLRLLPPGRVAVPFDVSRQHLGFDTFELVEQVLVSHRFTRDGDGGRYHRENSRTGPGRRGSGQAAGGPPVPSPASPTTPTCGPSSPVE